MPPLLNQLGAPPPFGSSPMTRPSANLGEAANAAALVGQAVDLLEKALTGTPPQHPLHKTLLDTIGKLSKAAPPQAQSQGVGLTALKQLLADKMRQSPMNPLMGGGGAGAGQPGAPPTPGMPPTGPMPGMPGASGPPIPMPT